ncbi:hypothetical protein D3C81_2333750 [compost metagenome]
MILGPFDHSLDLRPIGDITEVHQAQRSTGHDQPVKVFILDIFKVTVEIIQVLRRRVLRLTAIDAQ